MSTELKYLEVWSVTGGQHLYGNDALRQAAATGEHIEDFAEMVRLESLFIDQEMPLPDFKHAPHRKEQVE